MLRKQIRRNQKTNKQDYSRIKEINGDHPLKDYVPDSFVEYRARKRKGGRVLYFNFALAKEMGLISDDHSHRMNQQLEKSLLDQFSIMIINEYDILHSTPIDKKDILPNQYMATRYLQLQHPNKKGLTSGDGRSIWNGYFKGKRGTCWDVSSCGTGATCLSPATAIKGEFFKTGDKFVSYGCGLADVSDGISAALMSEVFHQNGTQTERTLLVIEFPGDLSINVRAGKNLLRPSHLFNHLKQNNLESLSSIFNYYVDRETKNKKLPSFINNNKKYEYVLEKLTSTFANAVAKFERDYIFCWMDWDGDNILLDGGIIDYGSVRQCGLYYKDYRYDDVDRFSTTIPEQKNKARYLIQSFVQMVDFIKSGKKKNINKFKSSKYLKQFDKEVGDERLRFLAEKTGFSNKESEYLMKSKRKLLASYDQIFTYFEMVTVSGPIRDVSDGVNRDLVFCMRKFLSHMPNHLLEKEMTLLKHEEFIDICKSECANKKDLVCHQGRKQKIKKLQKLYLELVEAVASKERKTVKTKLKNMNGISQELNHYERMTGDGIIFVAEKLLKERSKMSGLEFQHLCEEFIRSQVFFEKDKNIKKHYLKDDEGVVLENLLKIIKTCSEGI